MNPLLRRFVAGLFILPMLWGCSDGSDGSRELTYQQQLVKLSATLGSAEHPVNNALLLDLLEGELGSEPFYLADYVQLGEHDSADTDLEFYISGEADLLEQVGARLVLDNVVFNHVSSDDDISWDRHRVIYFPSPQAFADLITHPSYAELMAAKRDASSKIRGLWLALQLTREAEEDDLNKAEFYMLNLSKYREMALYPDGSSHGLTGEEASQIYGSTMLTEVLPSIGAYPVLAGEVIQHFMGEDGDWDSYATVRYPSIEDLLKMAGSAAFQAVFPNKGAGLEKNVSMMSLATLDPAVILVE